MTWLASATLVDGHGRDADRRVTPDDDERQVALDRDDGIDDTPDRRHDDDTLHPGRTEPVDRGPHVVSGSVQRDEGEEVTGLACRLLYGEEHLRRAELVRFDRHDPDRPRPPTGEDPGRSVRLVAEVRNGLLHAAPRRLGHTLEPVQDAGDGHDRDARTSRDVGHHDTTGPHVRAPAYSNQSKNAESPTEYMPMVRPRNPPVTSVAR